MNVGIIGGGACGVMSALTIKKYNPQVDVTILEQNDRILKKVLKTGNGKCNIANNIITSEMYNNYELIEQNSDINVIKELMDLGLVLKETTLGRVYPYSEQAKSVVNVLLKDIEKNNIEVLTNYEVKKIDINNKFIINDELKFDCLVMASGSIAQEKTNGYELLKKLGHHVTSLRPALVPIKVKEKVDHLQGLRIKCDAYANNHKLSGEILFKNDGLSGILALDLSRIVNIGDVITIDLMPDYAESDIDNLLKGKNKEDVLDGIFVKMITKEILKRGSNTSHIIKNFSFTVSGFYDFNDAQIVSGGLDVSEINNFESTKHKNLYIGGEVLDIDGASGGYNLYFAWLSGIVIGKDITRKIGE